MVVFTSFKAIYSNLSVLNASDREQLETVHRNSLRLLKLVNTLLDFSCIEGLPAGGDDYLSNLSRFVNCWQG
ncbi:MAG TPA: hypothetical protein IGS40_10955 [Trichormus sp. M33_DOE_039]|nr:hypothetical protein [Trichormus sp. M33_DOE_039]